MSPFPLSPVTSRLPHPAAPWWKRQAELAILAGYLTLTLLYGLLGHLSDMANRVVPVDSAGYYMYLPALFFQGNLDFSNELQKYYGPEHTNALTPTGRHGNAYSIGPAIFWAPFFLLAHLCTLLANAAGFHLTLDGHSSLYSLFVYIGNSLYGLLGFLFLVRLVMRFVAERIAIVSTLAMMLTSQMTYYLWSDTAMAHNTAFFATTLFLFAFLRFGASPWTGLAAAAVFLTRWQAILYLTPILVQAASQAPATFRQPWPHVVVWARRYIGFLGVFFLGISPQLLTWNYLYGHYFTVPHGAGFITLEQFHLYDILVSLHRGIFIWHPLLALALLGLPWLWKKDRTLTIATCLAIALQLSFLSFVSCWWAGWSFGQRFFIEALPMLTICLAALLEGLWNKRFLRGAVLVGLGALAVWNQLFIYQYSYGLIPRGRAVTSEQFFGDKFRLIERTKSKRDLKRALAAFKNDDHAAFYRFALLAYALNAREERTAFITGFASLLAGDSATAQECFLFLSKAFPVETIYAEGLSKAYSLQDCVANSREPCRETMDKIFFQRMQYTMNELVNG